MTEKLFSGYDEVDRTLSRLTLSPSLLVIFRHPRAVVVNSAEDMFPKLIALKVEVRVKRWTGPRWK